MTCEKTIVLIIELFVGHPIEGTTTVLVRDHLQVLLLFPFSCKIEVKLTHFLFNSQQLAKCKRKDRQDPGKKEYMGKRWQMHGEKRRNQKKLKQLTGPNKNWGQIFKGR